ncbi:hypothetical protein KP509_29G025600 [Ceratopteris richardii]|uniref:Uncharacterized protein n=1 Tax=Ceratopteris richardii TaxID=49495 RepID=A0A8T2R6S0_CERRI|nr:hypothetical protein KP509_29G025600 [Ceratopteris richardii]
MFLLLPLFAPQIDTNSCHLLQIDDNRQSCREGETITSCLFVACTQQEVAMEKSNGFIFFHPLFQSDSISVRRKACGKEKLESICNRERHLVPFSGFDWRPIKTHHACLI